MNIRPGTKTSEFAALVLTGVVLVADGSQYITVSDQNMSVFMGLIGSYVLGRSYVKAQEVNSQPATKQDA